MDSCWASYLKCQRLTIVNDYKVQTDQVSSTTDETRGGKTCMCQERLHSTLGHHTIRNKHTWLQKSDLFDTGRHTLTDKSNAITHLEAFRSCLPAGISRQCHPSKPLSLCLSLHSLRATFAPYSVHNVLHCRTNSRNAAKQAVMWLRTRPDKLHLNWTLIAAWQVRSASDQIVTACLRQPFPQSQCITGSRRKHTRKSFLSWDKQNKCFPIRVCHSSRAEWQLPLRESPLETSHWIKMLLSSPNSASSCFLHSSPRVLFRSTTAT